MAPPLPLAVRGTSSATRVEPVPMISPVSCGSVGGATAGPPPDVVLQAARRPSAVTQEKVRSDFPNSPDRRDTATLLPDFRVPAKLPENSPRSGNIT